MGKESFPKGRLTRLISVPTMRLTVRYAMARAHSIGRAAQFAGEREVDGEYADETDLSNYDQ
ncbi:hypothetical protein DN388_03825 [Pseudomonas sp. S12(2018)]|nr:hypothetical protein [Pseudomonas sp. S12(2018)]